VNDNNNTKTPLLLKKDDAKKANIWHDFADMRFRKQHGGYDIPEGDNHAIQKYDSPIQTQQQSPQEVKEVLTELEKEIQQLKDKEER
jgi:hypothetical protein